MAETDDSTEWHLTPGGWVPGSSKSTFGGRNEVSAPPDRVMTCEATEYQSSMYAPEVRRWSVTWQSPDSVRLIELQAMYGSRPKGYEAY